MRPTSLRPLASIALLPLIALPALACLRAGAPAGSPSPVPADVSVAAATPTAPAQAAAPAGVAAAAMPMPGWMRAGGMHGRMRGIMAGRMGGMGQGMGGPATCPMRAVLLGSAGAPVDAATLAARLAAADSCPEPTASLAADGRKLFMGKGNCYTCHGMDAQGTPLAPNLVSHKWINIDGSYAAIAKLVVAGVPRPKEHPAPMPAMGGAQLTPGEVCALAAYVYRLSHK